MREKLQEIEVQSQTLEPVARLKTYQSDSGDGKNLTPADDPAFAIDKDIDSSHLNDNDIEETML